MRPIILWAKMCYVLACLILKCKEMLDIYKKVSFFQGIGANPLFAGEEQVDSYFMKTLMIHSKICLFHVIYQKDEQILNDR